MVLRLFLKHIFLGFLTWCTLSVGQVTPAYGQDFIPPRPKNYENLQFSLLTVGLGEDLYARYGHTMIRVEDRENQLDYLINWGIFDFSDPLFLPKFFKGVLIYRMGFSSMAPTIRYYRESEKRSVEADDFYLTIEQKKAFLEKIIWNAQPENVNYPYQYFRNNCATKPRDYLDEIFKGAISRRFSPELTTLTFRDYVRNYLGINPFVGWGLDICFNGDVDHPISAWEEMFFPIKLREYLALMPAIADDGSEILGQTLLHNHRVLVDLKAVDGDAVEGHHLLFGFMVPPLLILLVNAWKRRKQKLDFNNKTPIELRVFGVFSIFWGLSTGVFGAMHSFGWAFSSHTDAHHNINLLMFWPTDLLLVGLGVKFLIKGACLGSLSSRKKKFFKYMSLLHLAMVPLYLLVYFAGWTVQDISRVVLFTLPASVLYFCLLYLYMHDRLAASGERGYEISA